MKLDHRRHKTLLAVDKVNMREIVRLSVQTEQAESQPHPRWHGSDGFSGSRLILGRLVLGQ